MNRWAFFGAILLALSNAPVGAAEESPTAFVQRFYDSYLKQGAPNWDRNVRNNRPLFDPVLADALLEDAAAQAKVPGDIVGIDFDPFLGSQDPGNRFVARGAVTKTGGYQVAVYEPEAKGKPTVLVDVAFRNGKWIITDFRYPNTSTELLSVLKSLKQVRASSRHR